MSDMQIVVFGLNGQLFGVETSQVDTIIRYQEVSKVPGMPRFLEGMINLRGNVIPVVNLNKRFDLGESEISKKTKIMITRTDNKYVGFIVNDVEEICKFSENDIEIAPQIMNSEVNAYLKSVGKMEDKLISIIDLENVLSQEEVKRLTNKPSQQQE